ncbi:MAG: Tm-1-like ATP-binding domain-containing protein [Desulfobacula sp.]|uniref:Tm-1-like ATP-binding domain-containing protein n=1 Tax=Desulfobacula sp. TaxID=2593537 RepID=UPI0025C64BA2|nr:Tm-1-like ATP-binding domain-containing protein [Desulfobacula sp.]MCD4721079.1 Tm-1-like ATP-binding domain-containing protein [Desulfobacula sp.]
MTNKKTVLILCTLDTKREETRYLKYKFKEIDVLPLLMDLSMRGKEKSRAELTPSHVASAGGSTIEEINKSKERSTITNIIIEGATKIAKDLYAAGKIDGIMALGGSTGSLMATDVMRALPFGIPKLMISSTAALPGLSTKYIGTGDILLFHSVIEIAGVTDMLANIMDRACYAMKGMINYVNNTLSTTSKKTIAMTMLGPCEQCASTVRKALEKKGYQVTGFSAAGVGDRAMEKMIAEGFFQGVIDLAPGGVGEHYFGFMRDGGPDRLESAGKKGIPQIISTCSVNHMTPSRSKYKKEFHKRRKYDLDKFRTWLRLSTDELKEVANEFARKLNHSKSPVKVMVPLQGWSSVDCQGNPTYDPKEDRIFIDTLRNKLNSRIEIIEVDANMEDAAFSQQITQTALELF